MSSALAQLVPMVSVRTSGIGSPYRAEGGDTKKEVLEAG